MKFKTGNKKRKNGNFYLTCDEYFMEGISIIDDVVGSAFSWPKCQLMSDVRLEMLDDGNEKQHTFISDVCSKGGEARCVKQTGYSCREPHCPLLSAENRNLTL